MSTKSYHEFMGDSRLVSLDGMDFLPELNDEGEFDFHGSEFRHTLSKEDMVKLVAVLTKLLGDSNE